MFSTVGGAGGDSTGVDANCRVDLSAVVTLSTNGASVATAAARAQVLTAIIIDDFYKVN